MCVAYVVDPDHFDYFVRRLNHAYELYKIMHEHLHGDALQTFNKFIQGAMSATEAFKKVFKVFQLVCETLSLLLLSIKFLLALQ